MWTHLKVFVLMAALTALLGTLGSLVGGSTGVVIAIAESSRITEPRVRAA